MKCNALVKWVEKGKKKTLRPTFWMHEEQYQETEKWIQDCLDKKMQNPRPGFPKKEQLIVCDGNVIAMVNAQIEGGCGCCGYAMLEITYECNKCQFSYYPNAPTTQEELSTFLTEKL